VAFWAWNFGALAQQTRTKAEPEEGTRQLWNNEFRRLRPSAPLTAKAVPGAGDAMVGVTIWRLRESRPDDDKEVRIPAGDAVKEWTPVRIAADTTLSEGQKVRVAVESARSGYLYVIDREQYADGAFGAPYLLFPVLRVRGGNNKVAAGRLIEIPGPEDNPRYLTMRMSRPDQVAEVLILLVTPNPLPDLKIERNPIQLSPAQVQAWEKKWGAKVERLEARRQLGKPYTRAEKEAALAETRLLTYEEPLPQTMYRLQVKPGDPLLVKVPLRIAK
jgi:hypothetical protein